MVDYSSFKRRLISLLKKYTLKELTIKVFKRLFLKFKYIESKILIGKELKKYKLKKYDDFMSSMNFYYNYSDKHKIKKYYKEKIIKEEIVNEADKILEGWFNLLNAKPVKLNKINWNKDYKSNFVWDNKFYKDIKIVDFSNCADVKNVWEISRFNHLFTIGKAFWITNDEKYYKEFKDQIISWEIHNPYSMSINWTCSMEVAIRAINFIFAYYHFQIEINNDLEFKNKFLNLLFYHAKFIYSNLENYNFLRNNHYISNLVGLLYLGLFFKYFDKTSAQKWINKSLKDLHREMDTQINDDGTSYETSTNYQRVVAELFLHAYMIAKLNNINFNDEFNMKLFKMHIFMKNIVKPNGLTPLVGDIDNGRLLIITNYMNWEKRYFSEMLPVFESIFCKNIEDVYVNSEELLWFNSYNNLHNSLTCDIPSKNDFKDGGFYLLKNSFFYLLIRCGELSMRGQGGHSHNDQLSFELNIKGKDIFIDPGSFTYSGSVKLRNLDRSTKQHNTISAKTIEQNEFNDDIFSMTEESFSKKIFTGQNTFIGEHYGFEKKVGIVHRREISINENIFVLTDNLKGIEESEEFEQNFILSESVEIINSKGKVSFFNDGIYLHSSLNYEDCEIEEIYVSIGYGDRIKSKKIKRKIGVNNVVKTEFYL